MVANGEIQEAELANTRIWENVPSRVPLIVFLVPCWLEYRKHRATVSAYHFVYMRKNLVFRDTAVSFEQLLGGWTQFL